VVEVQMSENDVLYILDVVARAGDGVRQVVLLSVSDY
jgi:hypothetical protein